MECPCSPLKKMLANNLCLPLFQLSPGNKMFLSKIRFKTSAALMPCAWQASPHAGAEGPRMVCVRLKLAYRKARLEKSTFLGNAAGFAQPGLGDYQSQSVTPRHGHPHVTLFVCPCKPPGLGPRKLLGLSCWWIREKGETAGIRFWLRDRQALWKAQVPMHRTWSAHAAHKSGLWSRGGHQRWDPPIISQLQLHCQSELLCTQKHLQSRNF